MRVIVCGSRRWNDRAAIESCLYELAVDYSGQEITVVHGGARGADRIAEQEAQKAGLLIERHLPRYDLHGAKRAPLVRNVDMAESGADLCIAFWDGRSTGTAHMIDQAHAHGIPVKIVSSVAA
jgi:hypothetical protein